MTAFGLKHGHVFLKRLEIFDVGEKWGGVSSTTIRFVLISRKLKLGCWICRWFRKTIKNYSNNKRGKDYNKSFPLTYSLNKINSQTHNRNILQTSHELHQVVLGYFLSHPAICIPYPWLRIYAHQAYGRGGFRFVESFGNP